MTTHQEQRHTVEHYRTLATGQVVHVADYHSGHEIANRSRQAELHERTAIGLHSPSGKHYLRATNAKDLRALRAHADRIGIPYTQRRAGGNHHGRQGAYDHLDFATEDDAAGVLAATSPGSATSEHPATHQAPSPPPAVVAPAPPPEAPLDTDADFAAIFGERLTAPAPDVSEVASDFNALFGTLPDVEPENYTVTDADIAKLKRATGCENVVFSAASMANWNTRIKVNPSEYLGKIYKPFGPGGTLEIECSPHGMSILYRRGTVQINRSYDLRNGSVSHSLFCAGDTGEDKGKALFVHSIDFYEKIGLKKITVHANINVGGYAWARYRFRPNDASSLDTIKQAIRRSPLLETWMRTPKFKQALESASLETAWDLVDFISKEIKEGRMTREQNPLAKNGVHWYGHIDLKDKHQMEAVRKYITSGRRPA